MTEEKQKQINELAEKIKIAKAVYDRMRKASTMNRSQFKNLVINSNYDNKNHFSLDPAYAEIESSVMDDSGAFSVIKSVLVVASYQLLDYIQKLETEYAAL